MLNITVTFCLGSTVAFTLINVSPGSLWKILVYDLNLEDTGHIAESHFAVLLLAKKDTFHSSAQVLQRKMYPRNLLVTTSQMFSVITERHWRHSLRVLILCLTLLALPSRTLQLKTIKSVFVDSSAEAAEVFCSDCKWLEFSVL